MGNLYAFAFTGKQDRMIANYIAASYCGEANSLGIPRTGLTFAPVDSDFL